MRPILSHAEGNLIRDMAENIDLNSSHVPKCDKKPWNTERVQAVSRVKSESSLTFHHHSQIMPFYKGM